MSQQFKSSSVASPTVAVIDVGSNTIKLLVAKGGAQTVVVHQKVLETRISRGIGRGRPKLSQEGIEAGLLGIESLLEEAAYFQPHKTSIAATSAVRDAENGYEFADLVFSKTNIQLRILSGEDEARTAAIGIQQDPHIKNYKEFYFLDIGGGSAEIAHCHDGIIIQIASLPLGAVSLTERFVSDPEKPLSDREAQSIARFTEEEIKKSTLIFGERELPFIGIGGTFAYIRALLNKGTKPRSTEFFPIIPVSLLRNLFADLSRLSLDKRKGVLHLPKSRADIFPTALRVILSIADHSRVTSFHHSYYNLQFGLAIELLSQVADSN